eukprot:TRINITY_DN1917_c0_g1_i1.p1 TRINITY_DN1917_c0_g1~~TRINITY_DN1917_c0_g1_i1.p1  ORF type:complete len:1614 (+),score=475.66 TRINITY_DN1917_c0_g1_i1:78-4844(+)
MEGGAGPGLAAVLGLCYALLTSTPAAASGTAPAGHGPPPPAAGGHGAPATPAAGGHGGAAGAGPAPAAPMPEACKPFNGTLPSNESAEPLVYCRAKLCNQERDWADAGQCISALAAADYSACEWAQCQCIGGRWTGSPAKFGGGCERPVQFVDPTASGQCQAGTQPVGGRCLLSDCSCGACRGKDQWGYGCGCKARGTGIPGQSCAQVYQDCRARADVDRLRAVGEPCLGMALCIDGFNYTKYEAECVAGRTDEHPGCAQGGSQICLNATAYKAAFAGVQSIIQASAPTDPSPAVLYPCMDCEWQCLDMVLEQAKQRFPDFDPHHEHGGERGYIAAQVHGASGSDCCDPMPGLNTHDRCELKSVNGSMHCELVVTCPCQRHAHEHELPYNIIALTGMVAVGNLCRSFAHLPLMQFLPYTVQVFTLGAMWGFMCQAVGEPFSTRFGGLSDIDPHLLFYVFLPILIFESAFATEYHVFKTVVWHCLFLAGPGLMICSFCTALVAKTMFTEYAWSWVACLLFGCVLSATDPVAVVALLKELGAAPAISALIEGESLLNDGTAIVFFGIFKDSVPGGAMKLSGLEVVLELIRVAGGGPLVGIILAFITKCSIKAVFNDPAIEITMTLVCAYATFFIAEAYFHVSGVLGLVVAGMYLAYHCHVITPEVEHSLHHFWEILVYMANTMIFAIAGLVIAQKAFDGLKSHDIVYLLITYVSVNIIRGVGLMCLLLPMNAVGKYKLNWRNAALCTWGGLRGAVGLALAVMILGDQAILCEHKELGSKMLFHCAGIVVFTLCINGVTTGRIVAALGLDAVSDSKKHQMQRTYRDVLKTSADKQTYLQRKREYRDCNWVVVKNRCADGVIDPHNPPGTEVEPPGLEQDAAEHYYRCFATAVEHEYEAGTMLPFSLRQLYAYLADAEARAEKGEWALIDVDVLKPNFELTWRQGRFVSTDGRLLHAFDVGIGFLNAHRYTLNHIDKLCNAPQAASRVKDHCKKQITRTVQLLDQITRENPEVSCSVKSRNAARTTLNSMRRHIAQMKSKGKLTPPDAALLNGMVEHNMKMLVKMPARIPPDVIQGLEEFCPWYGADPSVKGSLSKMFTVQVVEQGARVLDKAKDGQGIWVNLSGVVRVQMGSRSEEFGPGYSAGLLGTCSGMQGKFADVWAVTETHVAFFRTYDIKSHMITSDLLAGAMWDEACRLAARCLLSNLPQYRDWSHVKIAEFCNKGRRFPVRDCKERVVDLPDGHVSVLAVGCWADALMGRESGEGPCVLPKQLTSARLFDGAVLLAIPNPLSVSEQAQANWGKLSKALFIAQTLAALHNHETGKLAVKEILGGRFRKLVRAQMDQEASMAVCDSRAMQARMAGWGPKACPPSLTGDFRARPLHAQPEHLQHAADAAREAQERERQEELERLRQMRTRSAPQQRRPSSQAFGSPPLVQGGGGIPPRQQTSPAGGYGRTSPPGGGPVSPASFDRYQAAGSVPRQISTGSVGQLDLHPSAARRGSSISTAQSTPRNRGGAPSATMSAAPSETTPWFSQGSQGPLSHSRRVSGRGAPSSAAPQRRQPRDSSGSKRRQPSSGAAPPEKPGGQSDTVWL